MPPVLLPVLNVVFLAFTFIPSSSTQHYAFVLHSSDIGEDTSHARRSLDIIDDISNVNDALDFLFPRILDDAEECIQRAFLFSRNMFVDEFNDVVLDALPGDYESYFSSDLLKQADQVAADAPQQSPNYLAMLTHPNTPLHRLDLKMNTVCAVQRNMSVEKGLVRNVRVRITALH